MNHEDINIINQGSKFKGSIELDKYTRFNGKVEGEISGTAGSVIVLGSDSIIEGIVKGHVIIIDGFVRGEIQATEKVTISPTGRVIGKIKTPKVEMQVGCYFDGECACY